MTDNFTPSDHTVDEVKAYVDENPQDAETVLELEKARGDSARVTLVSHLEEVVANQHPAPVPVEPPAVTVAPKTDTVFNKEYEVSPERGYRVKK